MTKLFDRSGNERAPNVTGDKGQPIYRAPRSCSRCGGAGGSSKWEHTGFTCFDCGGSGKGSDYDHALYTADRLAALNASLAKRHAKAQAKRDAEAAARRAKNDAEWSEWYAAHKPACDAIMNAPRLDERSPRHDEERDQRFAPLLDDLAKEIANHVPVSDRALDVALGMIVRKFAEQDQRTASCHVGTIGERVELELVCEKVLSFRISDFPLIVTNISLCRDRAGNRVVYKGSNRFDDDGEWFKVKATIKAHESRDGELQTLIARPKHVD
jgi:hypothetical protein